MLAEGNAFTHIQREIEGRQSAVVVAPVAAAGGNKHSSGSPAVKTTSNGGTKKPGATAKSQAAAASSGGAALSTSSASPAVNTSGDEAQGGAIALDESLSIEVEVLVHEQFRKYTPKLFNGDFKAVVDANIAEWEGKFTLLMLDPPFGILDEAHDVLIPAADLLRECSRLLKPQGNVVVVTLQ